MTKKPLKRQKILDSGWREKNQDQGVIKRMKELIKKKSPLLKRTK